MLNKSTRFSDSLAGATFGCLALALCLVACGDRMRPQSPIKPSGRDAAGLDVHAMDANTIRADANQVTDAGAGPADSGNFTISNGCPRVIFGSALDVEFSGDTTALSNIVTSQRLEWGEAPDDSLEFVAPMTGDYVIELTSDVLSLGASAMDYNTNGSDGFPFTRTACPAEGSVKEIDGFYSHNQPDYPISLSRGQSMVIFVSAPYWANVKSGSYHLRIFKK